MADQVVMRTPAISIISKLEALVEKGDIKAFLETQQHINWQMYSPDEIVKAIQLALAVGAYQASRELSIEGSGHYPHHQLLQDYAHILAIPQVTRSDEQPDATIKMNQDWLRENRIDFRGKWVALHNGELLATANSLKLLTDQVDSTKETLFTKVF